MRCAARPAMSAKTIAKALGGRKAGGGWMARCPAHDDRKPSLSIRDARRRQGAGALPCRLRPGACHRRSAGARPVDGERSALGSSPAIVAPHADEPSRIATTPSAARPRSPSGSPQRRHEGTPVETYLASRGLASPAAADAPLPCRPEASLGRHLAGDGGAGDARRRRTRRSRSTAPSSPATAAARRRSIRRR